MPRRKRNREPVKPGTNVDAPWYSHDEKDKSFV